MKPPIKAKYHNKKTLVGDIAFDSKREAERYAKLDLLCRAGLISNLRRQVKFTLLEAQYKHYQVQGKRKMLERKELLEKSCNYYADFVYEKEGKMIVEDVKGMRVEPYQTKKKLMLFIHGIRIVEIK